MTERAPKHEGRLESDHDTEITKLDDVQTIKPEPYSAFSLGQRRFILGIVTAAGFFGPLSGGIYLPALPVLERAFSASSTVINATVSVFMVVFAVAPLIWAAGADFGGRKTIYLVSLAIFIIASLLLAVLPTNLAALFVLRILQAFGACGVTSIGAGTVADVTEPKHRASALSIFLLGPQIGPILGPVIGGALADAASWRWIFGFLAISCSALYILILFCLPETLRSLVGNGAIYANRRWIHAPRLRQKAVVESTKFPKPPRPNLRTYITLTKYPPTLIISVSGALLFAAYYAMLVTFPRFLEDIYGFSTTEVGLAYIAPGIAGVLGSIASGKASDFSRAKAVKRIGNENVPPERRIHNQIYGFILSSAGLLGYGWFCHFRIHAVAVLISSFLAGFGLTWIFVSSTAYQTECYPSHAASLVALGGLFRNPAAAIAAVIIEQLVRRMGIGWCFTGLAIMDLLCVAGVLFLMKKGSAFRKQLETKA